MLKLDFKKFPWNGNRNTILKTIDRTRLDKINFQGSTNRMNAQLRPLMKNIADIYPY